MVKKKNKKVIVILAILGLLLMVGGKKEVLLSQCNRCDPNNIPALNNDLVFCEQEHNLDCNVVNGCLVCESSDKSKCGNPTANIGQYVCSNDKIWECTGGGALGWEHYQDCSSTCAVYGSPRNSPSGLCTSSNGGSNGGTSTATTSDTGYMKYIWIIGGAVVVIMMMSMMGRNKQPVRKR